jgi:phage-related protein
MSGWRIIYYEDSNSVSKLFDYIESLDLRVQAKLLAWFNMLEERGPTLTRPYADLLEDGIHELRIKLTGKQVRVLYFFCYQKYIILTHSFVKTTDKVPVSEINKAKKLRDDFLKRYDETKLMEEYNENLKKTS